MNSVSLKRTETGWELSYATTETKTEQFPDLDSAITKLKELETPATSTV